VVARLSHGFRQDGWSSHLDPVPLPSRSHVWLAGSVPPDTRVLLVPPELVYANTPRPNTRVDRAAARHARGSHP